MSDVKSVQPPRKLLPAGVPGPAPASVARKSDDDDKSVSTDVVSAAPPSSPAALRDALISELLGYGRGVEVNRYYQGNIAANGVWAFADCTTGAGSATVVNTIPQGTGAGERLGDSVRNRRLRMCFHFRPGQAADSSSVAGPTAGVPSMIGYSFATRLIIGIDKMPVIGAAQYLDANSWGLGATFPKSFNSTHCNPRATFASGTTCWPGQILQSVRNPQTLSRYHILHDRIYNKSDRYNQWTDIVQAGDTASGGYYRTSSDWIELEFDLKNHITQWYDQTNTSAFFTNAIFYLVIHDGPATNPLQFRWMSELEFENIP